MYFDVSNNISLTRDLLGPATLYFSLKGLYWGRSNTIVSI